MQHISQDVKSWNYLILHFEPNWSLINDIEFFLKECEACLILMSNSIDYWLFMLNQIIPLFCELMFERSLRFCPKLHKLSWEQDLIIWLFYALRSIDIKFVEKISILPILNSFPKHFLTQFLSSLRQILLFLMRFRVGNAILTSFRWCHFGSGERWTQTKQKPYSFQHPNAALKNSLRYAIDISVIQWWCG